MGRRKIEDPDGLTEVKTPDDFINDQPKTAKKKKGKTPSFTEKELAEKTFFISKIVAGILKFDFTYREKDFDTEGQALARMADKFPVVGTILSFFDPLFFIGSIINKFAGLRRKPKEEKKEPQPQQSGGENVYPMAR